MNLLEKLKKILKRNQSNESITPYNLLGEEAGIYDLVDHFYDIMDSSSEAKNCRDLHEKDLCSSREKLKLFLTQWFGGPGTYSQRFGHPRMRMRHMKFKIGPLERDEWIWCMNQAIEKLKQNRNIHPDLEAYMKKSFESFASHMQNTK